MSHISEISGKLCPQFSLFKIDISFHIILNDFIV